MLTWDECAALIALLPEEAAALGERPPTQDFLEFVMDPYFYDEPLKDRPGIKIFLRDDILAAQKRGSYDLSGLYKLGIRQRLLAQGYAGPLPEMAIPEAARSV